QVARLNGADGYSPYFPVPMPHYLIPISMPVSVILDVPPYFLPPREFEHVYFARGWSPKYLKAQPPHKTTWRVKRGAVRSTATARLWLDLRSSRIDHNGGFPRPNESWIRGLFIQAFYPQFNARLMDKKS